MGSPDQPQHNFSFSDECARLLEPCLEFTSLFKTDSINEHAEIVCIMLCDFIKSKCLCFVRQYFRFDSEIKRLCLVPLRKREK